RSASDGLSSTTRMNTQIRLIEPLGERVATLPLDVGGEGAALVLPGATDNLLRIEPGGRQWLAEPANADGEHPARINGVALRSPVPLVDGDVITLGDAQVVVHPAAARIDVFHLGGNATVAPLRQGGVLPGDEVEAGVREVFATGAAESPAPAARASRRKLRLAVSGTIAALVLAVVGVLLAL